MEYLCGLLVALFVITLVGHGIWVGLAKLGRALGSEEPSEHNPSPAHRFRQICRNCEEPLDPSHGRCPRCGMSRGMARQVGDLHATLRHLQEFHREGLLDAAQFERLREGLETRRRALTGQPLPAVAQESPAATSPPALASAASLPLALPDAAADAEAILEVLPAEDTSPVSLQVSRPRRKKAVQPETPPPPPPPPPVPRRTLAEWLAAFMEERNILWGEVIGGLLMVGCSIALVLSLWRKLEEAIPYFPFLILAGMTAAVFGMGQYTFHRWKLPSTSRGLLVIATLLVPLNFIVLAGLSQGSGGGFVEVATKAAGVAAFAWLVHGAGRVLLPMEEDTPRWRSANLLLPLAVVGTPVSQLSVVRCIHPPDLGAWFVPLATWPVVLHALGVGGFLARQVRRRPREESGALLVFLGLSAFAVALSLGFIGFWAVGQGCPRAEVLDSLAILVALIGVPSLAVGLFIRQCKTGAAPGSTASHLLMIGTAVALVGLLVMLAAVVMAWPHPVVLLVVCILNFVVFTGVAFLFELPVAHAAALVCLTVGYLTGYHLGVGELFGVAREAWAATLTELAYSGRSGSALLVLFGVAVAAAEGLSWKGRAADAFFYRAGACVIASISLILAGSWGIGEPERATIVYGVAAVSALVLSRRWRWAWLDHAGAALALATTLWCLHWGWPREYPAWGFILAAEALLFSAVAGRWWPEVLAAAGLALVTMVARPDKGDSLWHSYSLFALAATAFVQVGRRRWAELTWLGSGLVLVGVVHLLAPRFPELSPPLPLLAALLIHATLMQCARFAIRRRWPQGVVPFAIPLGQSVLVPMVLAIPMLLVRIEREEMQIRALYAAWLAGLWLAQALVERRVFLFPVFQAVISGAVLFGVAGVLVGQTWVIDDYPHGLLDPRSLQAFGLGLTGLSLCWCVVRLVLRSEPVAQDMLESLKPSVDRVVLGAVVVAQALVALGSVGPGVVRELAPRSWELGEWPAWSAVAAHISGPGAWLMVGGLALTLILWLWEARSEGRQTATVLGLLILALTIPLLAAGRFVEETAVASALRWGLAGCFLAASVPLWLREGLAPWISRLGIYTDAPHCAMLSRRFLLAATALPVVCLSVGMAAVVLAGEKPSGPGAQSFFAHVGSLTSHLIPLSLVLIGITGHALRERSQADAFAAGLVALLVVTGGYALSVVQSGASLGAWQRVVLLQLGTITAACWALGWLGVLAFGSGWARPASAFPRSVFPAGSLLRTQVVLGVLGNILLLAFALPPLVIAPGPLPVEGMLPFGQVFGWLALGSALAAVVVYSRRYAPSWQPHAWSAAVLAMGVLLARTLAREDDVSWNAYHMLMFTWTAAAWGIGLSIPFLTPAVRRWEENLLAWAHLSGALVVGLAVRAAWEDPARVYYVPSLAVLAIALSTGSLALRRRRLVEVVVAGGLFNLASVLAWIVVGPHNVSSFICVNVLGFSEASIAWAVVEQVRRATYPHGRPLAPREESPLAPREVYDGGEGITSSAQVADFSRPFRHGTAIASAVTLSALAGFGLFFLKHGSPMPLTDALAWCAWVAVAVALVFSLWDGGAQFPLPALYSIGLTGVAMILQGLGWQFPALPRAALLMTASYVLLAALTARFSVRLEPWREVLRLPPPTLAKNRGWFFPTQAAVAGLVLLLSTVVAILHDAPIERLDGPLSVGLVMAAAFVLAWQSEGEHEKTSGAATLPLSHSLTVSWVRPLRYAVLVLGVLLLSEIDWAVFDPMTAAGTLHRGVGVLLALAAVTVAYGFGLPRLLPTGNVWAADGRKIAPVLGLAASVAVAVVLLLEGLAFNIDTRHTPLFALEIVGVLLALGGLMTAGIAFAVVPWSDPFQLSERRRPYYVYASELMLVFFVLHVRLNVPELFVYLKGKYWTFFVMAVAFIGVGLSEFFRRRKLHVLASPLQRTGIFLPLLPVIAFWVKQPAEALHDRLITLLPGLSPLLESLHRMEQRWDFYAILWFLFGMVYAWVAITRRSYWYALAASLAANFGLWALLHGYGPSPLAHPQVWLIPLALIVLVSEVVNRPHLSRELSTGLRYLGLGLLYISSTADFFIAGLGDYPLALVLAVLSVLGVLAGMLFRVRSYLYLGVGFLVLVIFSMIWHAAVDLAQVWVWWASGIVLGAAILTLFALFEKRRQDLLHVVQEFRSWH